LTSKLPSFIYIYYIYIYIIYILYYIYIYIHFDIHIYIYIIDILFCLFNFKGIRLCRYQQVFQSLVFMNLRLWSFAITLIKFT
jgi:hypothetical protein